MIDKKINIHRDGFEIKSKFVSGSLIDSIQKEIKASKARRSHKERHATLSVEMLPLSDGAMLIRPTEAVCFS